MKLRYIVLGLVLCLGFNACARSQSDSQSTAVAEDTPAPTIALEHARVVAPGAAESIGIVRTAPLLAQHRLASMLAADNRELLILQHVADGDGRVANQAEIVATQKHLESELRSVAARSQARLNARAQILGVEERSELSGLLSAADRKTQARNAAYAVVERANAALGTIAATQNAQFSAGISAEQRSVLQSVQSGLDTQSRVALEAKASQFSLEESNLATELAKHDAQERITLRLKQANLHLAPDQLSSVDTSLANLDRDQNAALAKKRADDATGLAQYADDLKHHRAVAAADAAQSVAGVGRDANSVNAESAAVAGPPPAPAVIVPTTIDPRLRARIAAIHAKYQAQFTRDEKVGIVDFQSQRQNFQAQLQALERANAAAMTAAQRRGTDLLADREHIRLTMQSDLERAVKRVAARDHLSTVIVDPLGASNNARDITSEVGTELATSSQ